MLVETFRELRVYRRAVELRRGVFETSKLWPPDERFSLTDQVRRSARSISANIAEAWSKRRYQRHFVSKLSDAHAEASETSVWLDTALECGYINAELHAELCGICDEICGGLTKMMHQSERWCGPSQAREEEGHYEADKKGVN